MQTSALHALCGSKAITCQNTATDTHGSELALKDAGAAIKATFQWLNRVDLAGNSGPLNDSASSYVFHA